METFLQLSAAVVFMALYAFYYLNKQPESMLETASINISTKTKSSKKKPSKAKKEPKRRPSSAVSVEQAPQPEKIPETTSSVETKTAIPTPVQKPSPVSKPVEKTDNIKSIVKTIQTQLALLPEKTPVILEQLKLAQNSDLKEAKKQSKSLEHAIERSQNEVNKLSNELTTTKKNLTIAQKEVQEHTQRAKFVEDRARQEVAKNLEALKSENSKLKSENSRLSNTQNTHDQRNAELELIAKKRLDQINILQNISKSTAISNRLAQLNEESSKKVPELESEVQQLKMKLQASADETAKVTERSKKLQTALDDAKKQIKSKNKEINALSQKDDSIDKAKITELENKIQGLEAVKVEYAKNAELLKESLTEKDAEISEKSKSIQALNSQVEEYKSSSEELPQLVKDVCALQTEKAELEGKNEVLQDSLDQSSKKSDELEKEIENTNSQLVEANSEVAAYKNELSVLRTKLESFEVEFETLKSEKSDLQSQNDNLESKISDLSNKIASGDAAPKFDIQSFNAASGLDWRPDSDKSLENQLASSVKLFISEREAKIISEKDQQLKEEGEKIRKSYETKAQISEDKLINVRAETAKIEKAMLDYKSKFETMNCATLSATERLCQIEQEFANEREQWMKKLELAELEKQQEGTKYSNLMENIESKLLKVQDEFDVTQQKLKDLEASNTQLKKLNGGVNGSKSEEEWVKLDEAVVTAE